jgi:hypothetical protein
MRLPKQVAASLEWCEIVISDLRRVDEVMTSRVEAQATLKVEEPSCQMKRLFRYNLDVRSKISSSPQVVVEYPQESDVSIEALYLSLLEA